MRDDRKDLPPANSPNFLEKVREAVQVYLGSRGNRLDRGLTVRDLADAGLVALRPGFLSGPTGGAPIAGPGTAIANAYEPDLTPPPTPSGFAATAAISNLLVQCDPQLYTAGHGHAKSVLYGASWSSGPLPVFADAVVLTEFSGTVFAHATNPATKWHLWLKWVTVDGIYSTSPAGGTNGLVATTGQDVAPLLTALSAKITESQLFSALGTRINLIDDLAEVEGSVNARVLAEATARNTGITTEATARADADGSLFAQYTVKVDVAGLVSGYGLASTATNAAPISAFGVRANQFFVAPPSVASATAPTVDLYDGYVWLDTSVTPNVTRYRSGISWVLVSPTLPFVVQVSPTTVNGLPVPAGVYMPSAFIKNASIGQAQIASVKADSITAGVLQAVVSQTGAIFNGVNAYTMTTNPDTGVVTATYTGQTPGTEGFGTGYYIGTLSGAPQLFVGSPTNHMLWNGSNLTVRGTVYASSGSFAGSLSAATGTFSGSLTAATGTFSGSLTAAAVNAVNTINLAGQAVTIPVGASTSTTSDVTTTPTSKLSATIVSTGAPISITASASTMLYMAAGATIQAMFGVFRNGTQISPNIVSIMDTGATGGIAGTGCTVVSDTPGAGSHTYEIRVWTTSTPSYGSAFLNAGLFVLEIKR